MQSLVEFNKFFSALNITERVEDLLREVNTGHSKLETLVNSYKVLPRAHIRSIKTEAELSQQVLPADHGDQIEQLLATKSQIDQEDGIILLNDLYEQFVSTVSSIRAHNEPELSLRLQHENLVRRNEQIAVLVNDQTEELCSRIMYEAEKQRALKKDLRDKLENLKIIAREEMTNLIVTRFQDLRLIKLRKFATDMGNEHQRSLDEKLQELRHHTALLQNSKDKTRSLENELSKHFTEQRHSSCERNYELLSMTNQLKQLQIEVNQLDESATRYTKKCIESNSNTCTNTEELNKSMSGLAVRNAHLEAQLCKLVKRARSNNLAVEDYKKRASVHIFY